MEREPPRGNAMNVGSSVLHGASSNQIPGAQFNTSEGITINIQQGVQRPLDELVDSSSVLHQGQRNLGRDRTLNHVIESQEPPNRQDEECTEEQSAHAIYERQLLPKQHGFPLWIPQPNILAFPSHRRKGVLIGDLGRVTRSGAFDVLLNICKPAGPPDNPDELPDGFEPLVLKANDIHRFQEFTSGSYIASASVNKLSGLTFRCSRSEGAVLTMPDGALCEDLRNITMFRDFAAENAERWYRFVNGPCGWDLRNGELRLVTGCDKTTSWGLAAYNNIQSRSDASDTVRGEPLLRLRRSTRDFDDHISRAAYCWEHEGMVEVKTGPELEVSEDLPNNGARAWNQCTFVRLHTIKLSEAEWARVQSTLVSALDIRRASKEAQPKSKNYFDFLMNSFAYLGILSSDRIKGSATITESHISSPAVHPSTFIANKLLEEHPHAKVAIVHDGDWGAVIGENEDGMPTGPELWKRVKETFNAVLDSKGTVYLLERSTAPHRSPHEKAGGLGMLQASASMQASAAQPPSGPELRRQLGESTKTQGQQRGSADPPVNEGVDGDNRDGVAMRKRPIAPLQRQPSNGSPAEDRNSTMPKALRSPPRRLVIAFDIGTTFSGVSYSVLDPGQVPEITGVSRFPALKYVSGSAKVPTIIYYDQQGAIRAIGAEAIEDEALQKAEDAGWTKAEWFKLHLLPKPLRTDSIMAKLPPLPNGKTAIQVFADYLRYLFECTCTCIKDTHTNGDNLFGTPEQHIDYVLSHPNGWGGPQQHQMQEAAMLAGLIPDTPAGHSRISFVTEGEASLQFAINNGFPSTKMGNVLIADAGGGTIDISAYAQQSNSYVEIATPQCHLSGSVFVTAEARKFLSDFLSGSKYISDLEHILKCFDKTTKHTFRDAEGPQFIKFGSTRDNEPKFNIHGGRLKLTGQDVASFFEPSIRCIVNSVKEQRKLARQRLSDVVVVGGFASSDYLYRRLQKMLGLDGFLIFRPESHVSKAVADGAISIYFERAKVAYRAHPKASVK